MDTQCHRTLVTFFSKLETAQIGDVQESEEKLIPTTPPRETTAMDTLRSDKNIKKLEANQKRATNMIKEHRKMMTRKDEKARMCIAIW